MFASHLVLYPFSWMLQVTPTLTLSSHFYVTRKSQWELGIFRTSNSPQNLFLLQADVFKVYRDFFFFKCIMCAYNLVFKMNVIFICFSVVAHQDMWSSAFQSPHDMCLFKSCEQLYCLRQEKYISRLFSLLLIFHGLYKSKSISSFFILDPNNFMSNYIQIV